MILDQKPLIYFWRPFYRFFFVPLVRPFLAALRNFFTAPLTQQVSEVAAAVKAVQQQKEQLTELSNLSRTLQARIDSLETETARQWRAIEQLLLAVLSEKDRN